MAGNEAASRSSLVVERHYMPRSAPRNTGYDHRSNPIPSQRSPGYSEQLSPGVSSLNSNSPNNNGYVSGYAASEVSSMAGSVSSMPAPRQPLDPRGLPYNSRYVQGESGDSGMYSAAQRAPSYAGSTTSYATETDLDSVSGYNPTPGIHGSTSSYDSRYRDELFKPKAAPRIEQRAVRQMYGEVHPKHLRDEDLPTPSSGDELETMSEASIPSFTDVPRARPRASLRRKKLSELNSAFTSDDESLASQPIDRSKSLPRGILKASTDISDAESLATSGNFRRTASGRTVRFQHHDKARTIPKKSITYDEGDSDASSKTKKKKASSDPFSQVKPMGIKEARNDPKRSSGRDKKRSSQKGSQRGRGRSSSQDRSRPSSRSSSLNRDRAGSGRGRSSSADGSRKRSSSQERASSVSSAGRVSVKGDDVKIEMPAQPKPKNQSMLKAIAKSENKRDTQKILKWCLIVGVPVTLIIVVIGVVVGVFSG